MIVGFTGSRHGMDSRQEGRLRRYLRTVGCTIFLHGDCIGADAQAHHIAMDLGIAIVIHPPIDEKARAHCIGPEDKVMVLAPNEYLARNRAIVKASEAMCAAPQTPEVLRSGTWSTIRWARKKRVPVSIFMPKAK